MSAHQPTHHQDTILHEPDAQRRKTEHAALAPAFIDNRPVAQRQHALNALANANLPHIPQAQRTSQRLSATLAVAQRTGVGLGAGTDNDRNSIHVADLDGNERISATRDADGAAEISSDFIINNVNQRGQKLKHYMVVKSGNRYQFPIKHVSAPRQRMIQLDYVPNGGNRDYRRGGQPEGFGGNTDLAENTEINDRPLTESRAPTLSQEYQEENRAHGGAALNVTRSQKFGSGFGAGTLSIAATNAALAAGSNAHPLTETAIRGQAEMAGTVVIDCGDLVTGLLIGDDLEHEIGRKLQTARDNFYGANAGHDRPGRRQTAGIFNVRGGILAHLVGMVKDDIMDARAIANFDEPADLARIFWEGREEEAARDGAAPAPD